MIVILILGLGVAAFFDIVWISATISNRKRNDYR